MATEPETGGAVTGRRLVLVRHGQTAWNAERRAQGQADVPLDDTGRQQAERMAPVVADYDPVLLVSSDLSRARETAALLEKETGLTAQEDQRLREYDLGDRTGLTHDEFVARSGGEWDPIKLGAETEHVLAERIVPALTETLARLDSGQTAVLVLHGGSLRVAVAGVLGWPLEAAESLGTLDNCGWALLVEDREHGLRLAAYNLTVGDPHPDSRHAGPVG